MLLLKNYFIQRSGIKKNLLHLSACKAIFACLFNFIKSSIEEKFLTFFFSIASSGIENSLLDVSTGMKKRKLYLCLQVPGCEINLSNVIIINHFSLNPNNFFNSLIKFLRFGFKTKYKTFS